MDDTKGGDTGRDREALEIELKKKQAQFDRLMLHAPRHPCDRSEVGYQLQKLTARIDWLKKQLKEYG